MANSCKELYNLIEESLYNKLGENPLKLAYLDLCNGDFSEPTNCMEKKETFTHYKLVFIHLERGLISPEELIKHSDKVEELLLKLSQS